MVGRFQVRGGRLILHDARHDSLTNKSHTAGYRVEILDHETSKPMKPNELGDVVLKLPLPPGWYAS